MTAWYVLIPIMTLLGAVASLFLKKASGAAGIGALLRDYNLYLGGFLYVTAAVLNIILLRYLEYSVVLPLTALTYVWTMILSRAALGEAITRKKIIGVALILCGAVCVSL